MYPYLLLWVYHNGLRSGKVVDCGCMLPHGVGAVGNKIAIQHPADQTEAQVHSDVVIQGPVVRR